MERFGLEDLKNWWESYDLGSKYRKPLVLRGARQPNFIIG
jgi:hypothetical protein